LYVIGAILIGLRGAGGLLTCLGVDTGAVPLTCLLAGEEAGLLGVDLFETLEAHLAQYSSSDTQKSLELP